MSISSVEFEQGMKSGNFEKTLIHRTPQRHHHVTHSCNVCVSVFSLRDCVVSALY